jgi:hypothetical protein
MIGGGGVGEGLIGVLATSLMRLGAAGGGSSLSKAEILNPPLRGSDGRGGAATGVGVPA